MNKDFAKGMIVSLALKSLPVRKKSPIAYLYNGVRMPALPEWDREMYPYVFLTKQMLAGFGGIADYELRVVSKPTYTHASNGNYVVCYEGYYEYFEGEGWKELKQASGSIHSDYIKWANFDITDENGAVVLEKSTPIPIYNEPVNYLYNGVELPKLPEWDKDKYPYVCMSNYTDDSAQGWYTVLHMSSEPPVYTGVIFGNTAEIAPPRLICEINRDLYSTGVKKWTEIKEATDSVYGVSALYEIFWSNVDILQDDGTAYVTASDPVPVYE